MQKEILEKLHFELKGRNLYAAIAKQYGCNITYVSQVLSGSANYNQSLVDIAVLLLNRSKATEKQDLLKTRKALGLKIA